MPIDKKLYKRIDEVIHYIWDPIGVSDVPEARDEYIAYLPQIYTLVQKGDLNKIVEYLKLLATDQMGLTFDLEKSTIVAEILLNWQECITAGN